MSAPAGRRPVATCSESSSATRGEVPQHPLRPEGTIPLPAQTPQQAARNAPRPNHAATPSASTTTLKHPNPLTAKPCARDILPNQSTARPEPQPSPSTPPTQPSCPITKPVHDTVSAKTATYDFERLMKAEGDTSVRTAKCSEFATR